MKPTHHTGVARSGCITQHDNRTVPDSWRPRPSRSTGCTSSWARRSRVGADPLHATRAHLEAGGSVSDFGGLIGPEPLRCGLSNALRLVNEVD